MIRVSMWDAIRALWTTTWHAIIVWMLIAPFFVALAYAILAPLLRRMLRRQVKQTAEVV
jgi:hypothetical protein